MNFRSLFNRIPLFHLFDFVVSFVYGVECSVDSSMVTLESLHHTTAAHVVLDRRWHITNNSNDLDATLTRVWENVRTTNQVTSTPAYPLAIL